MNARFCLCKSRRAIRESSLQCDRGVKEKSGRWVISNKTVTHTHRNIINLVGVGASTTLDKRLRRNNNITANRRERRPRRSKNHNQNSYAVGSADSQESMIFQARFVYLLLEDFVNNAPYADGETPLRYSLGVIPTILLNSLLNVFKELKPLFVAINETFISLRSVNSFLE